MRYTIILFLVVSSHLLFSDAAKCKQDGKKVRIYSIRECSVSKTSFEKLISVVLSVVHTREIAVAAIVAMSAIQKLQDANRNLL